MYLELTRYNYLFLIGLIMLNFLKRRVWVPRIIYSGLPWMCIFTTFVSYVIPNVPPIMIITTTLLGLYALIVLAIRYSESKF